MKSNHNTDQNSFQFNFSPCPNDTFMFDALVNGKIDNNDFTFNVQLEDIETLNQLAIKGEPDITKISFAAYSKVMDEYELLTAGSALGSGVGPLFISKRKFLNPEKEIKSVAIPGKNTTAYFLFKLFYPTLTNVKEIVFSEIEQSIIDEEVDAGIIIHENRFTYESKGLLKISDLGELWEKKTGYPIPLGGIAIRRSIEKSTKNKINDLFQKSIEYAFANPKASYDYVKSHAQEMDEDVRKKHIELYVNDYSSSLGKEGKKAIEEFLKITGTQFHTENIFI
jgi:1,4-dihydroxy-6-naphthoate synthase